VSAGSVAVRPNLSGNRNRKVRKSFHAGTHVQPAARIPAASLAYLDTANSGYVVLYSEILFLADRTGWEWPWRKGVGETKINSLEELCHE
jgi:hypothetical protein